MKVILKNILLVIVGTILTASLYLQWVADPLPTNRYIDKIIVEKSRRLMHIYSQDDLLKTYHISLGFNPIRDKKFEGDGRTPEGIYEINSKNPESVCFLNLGISYPNENDIAGALKLGKNPGGDIKIHGIKNGYGIIGKLHLLKDWTNGCIAVTNNEIRELYLNVPIGCIIEIRK
ncbi:MAG: L,D-transpeptidase family protein [Ignavibacteriaceae bacterium]